MPACIRLAVGADVMSVLELVRELSAPGQRAQTLSWEACAALLGDDRVELLVIDQDGVVVGYALTLYHPVLRSRAPVAMVNELVIHGPCRRRGFGSLLVRAAISRAWDAGCGEVVLATAGAGEFYERLGFRRTAGYYKLTRPA